MHLFELEDQPWFPAIIRNLATDYLRFIEVKFALHRPVVPLLRDLLRRTETFSVVDLCSGGAGPIESIAKELSAEGINVKFTLTDLFPNVAAFQRAAHESSGLVGFVPDLVDARAVPRPLRGLRTMFNAFHHFDRQDAIAVLRDAADAGQPIAIFEIPDRKFRTLLPLLVLTPLMVAIATPFIAPFTWRRLLWTYLIPLVPLTCWWDGIISALRAR